MASTTVKFTREFGPFILGGGGHTLVLASDGYADILVQGLPREMGGYGVFRRGDDDLIARFDTQRDAKAYAIEARAIDQQG